MERLLQRSLSALLTSRRSYEIEGSYLAYYNYVPRDEINLLLVAISIHGGQQAAPGCLVILTESSRFESRQVLNIIQAATMRLGVRISLIITVSQDEINSRIVASSILGGQQDV
jgi:hypothetical protein